MKQRLKRELRHFGNLIFFSLLLSSCISLKETADFGCFDKKVLKQIKSRVSGRHKNRYKPMLAIDQVLVLDSNTCSGLYEFGPDYWQAPSMYNRDAFICFPSGELVFSGDLDSLELADKVFAEWAGQYPTDTLNRMIQRVVLGFQSGLHCEIIRKQMKWQSKND